MSEWLVLDYSLVIWITSTTNICKQRLQTGNFDIKDDFHFILITSVFCKSTQLCIWFHTTPERCCVSFGKCCHVCTGTRLVKSMRKKWKSTLHFLNLKCLAILTNFNPHVWNTCNSHKKMYISYEEHVHSCVMYKPHGARNAHINRREQKKQVNDRDWKTLVNLQYVFCCSVWSRSTSLFLLAWIASRYETL